MSMANDPCPRDESSQAQAVVILRKPQGPKDLFRS
jgi:hypothetical protein